MASKRIIDLNIEDKEDLDLTLFISKDKDKRSVEGTLEKQKKKKKKKINEDQQVVSTGRSSEDKVACLERKIEQLGKKIEDLEKLSKRQDVALAARIERYFFWSTKCFYNQTQRNVDCMTAIYTSLYHIAQFLKPKTASEVMLQFMTTPKYEDPSTSKKPRRF